MVQPASSLIDTIDHAVIGRDTAVHGPWGPRRVTYADYTASGRSLAFIEDFLHHNFVVALLNDLFGIQARGGCSCAGPYGHRLLGIDLDRSSRFRRAIEGGCEGVKPGWVRVNFNYFISETVFRFIVDAVLFVAEHGSRLLPCYEFEPSSGLWRHRSWRSDLRPGLDEVRIGPDGLEYEAHHLTAGEEALPGYLEEAHRIVAEVTRRSGPPGSGVGIAPELESLRWFPLPGEIATFRTDDTD